MKTRTLPPAPPRFGEGPGEEVFVVYFLALSSTPIQIDTLSETLGFTSGTVSGSSVVRRSAQSLSPTAALHAVTPVFDRAVNAVYRSRREAFAHYVMAHRAQLAKEFVR